MFSCTPGLHLMKEHSNDCVSKNTEIYTLISVITSLLLCQSSRGSLLLSLCFSLINSEL